MGGDHGETRTRWARNAPASLHGGGTPAFSPTPRGHYPQYPPEGWPARPEGAEAGGAAESKGIRGLLRPSPPLATATARASLRRTSRERPPRPGHPWPAVPHAPPRRLARARERPTRVLEEPKRTVQELTLCLCLSVSFLCMSLSLSVCLCLSVSLCISLYVSASLCVSVSLFVSVSFCVCLSLHLCLSLCLFFSVFLSFSLLIHIFI